MTDPKLQATQDQLQAAIREWFADMGVDMHDPVQLRAIKATVLILGRFDLMFLDALESL